LQKSLAVGRGETEEEAFQEDVDILRDIADGNYMEVKDETGEIDIGEGKRAYLALTYDLPCLLIVFYFRDPQPRISNDEAEDCEAEESRHKKEARGADATQV